MTKKEKILRDGLLNIKNARFYTIDSSHDFVQMCRDIANEAIKQAGKVKDGHPSGDGPSDRSFGEVMERYKSVLERIRDREILEGMPEASNTYDEGVVRGLFIASYMAANALKDPEKAGDPVKKGVIR